MDEKALLTLEFPKVLERLARHTAFAVSRGMALAARPQTDLAAIQGLLAEAAEARALIEEEPKLSIGGARDVREALDDAERGLVLTPGALLDIKSTLVAARTMQRRFTDMDEQAPHLASIAASLPQPSGLVDAISQAISATGDILDSASPELNSIRSRLAVTHDRLLDKMNKLLTSAGLARHLQEPIITQREGRYVLPIKAESRGKVKAVVHDQSSSGATLFVEPLAVVDLNNEWRELQLAERDEEQRILKALSALVAEQAADVDAAMLGLAQLDYAFARARYAIQIGATEIELVTMKPAKGNPHPGLVLRLFGARHPLLDPKTVVPLDVDLHPQNYCLVITGPNTGGKTVTLKTVGLMALMAQSGMQAPVAAGSQMSVFAAVYADIGDEQSIEQSLSTFSGHITKIVRILDEADQRSLVILDELGAGTDPQEGAALARALLDHLVGRGISTLVATHYPELKAYAHATEGVVNASVEFNLETLAPTYHLTVGLPGRSNALAIAKRLGLREDVIEAARGTIDPDELKAEDLLNEIHRERDRAREALQRAEQAQHVAEAHRRQLAERLEAIEDERIEVLGQAREESEQALEALRSEINRLRTELARAHLPLDELQQLSAEAEALEAAIETPPQRQVVPESAPSRPLRLGDMVMVRTLGQRGIVTALGKQEAEVQIGALRARARITELELAAQEVVEPAAAREPVTTAPRVESPGAEVSLRGQRYEEAFANLDRYLDQAYAAGLPFVRIIHGKGTGQLRTMVRDELGKRRYVRRYEEAQPHEGGEGVTVAFFE